MKVILSFLMGFIVMSGTSYAIALTRTQISEIANFQEYNHTQGRDYDSYCEDDYCVFTYEQLCKGFYVVQYEETQIVSDGFGDLEDEYTWQIPIITSVATTSDEGTTFLHNATTSSTT